MLTVTVTTEDASLRRNVGYERRTMQLLLVCLVLIEDRVPKRSIQEGSAFVVKCRERTSYAELD